MKKEIKRLHQDMAEYKIKCTPADEKLLDFMIRIVEILKQVIEKIERKNK